jgi:hypothetical protein
MGRLGAASALAFALVACQRISPADERTVRRYLLCEECRAGEQDSVIALGQPGQDALEAALKGPPKDRIETVRLQAEAMYDRIPSPATTRQQYVDHYLGNYKALYVERAAQGLARFNTPSAHAALIQAVRSDTVYREDVRPALGAVAGVVPTVFAGDHQHGMRDSLLKLEPTVRVVDTTSGHGLSGVRVVFLVDSGGGSVLDTVRFTDSEGKAATRWLLGPIDSVNTLRAVAAGRAVRIHALGHENQPRVVFLVQPSNGTKKQSITPPIRFAVHDAWGALKTNFTLSAQVTVVPLGLTSADTVNNGVGDLTGFSVPQAGTGLRLKVAVSGAQPGLSQPFDIAP